MFHPLINRWFQEKYSGMTDAQAQAWPLIAESRHVLVVAPTGSGKTLTAFLGAIDNLVRGTWSGPGVKVLYVSPLKALNNDIRRNLLAPLAELRTFFGQNGQEGQFPPISVQTRSGDTSSEERRRLVHSPPDILVTTPESLNIMLCSRSGRGMLGSIRLVILDEIHALVASKRGTHLISAVERLTLLSGEFQRIGLSATVKPARLVAEWMGGYSCSRAGELVPRPVAVVESTDERRIQLDIISVRPPELPPDTEPGESRDAWWESLANQLVTIIRQHRSTLVFANSRRLTEKVCRYINDSAGEILAYSHHGSLSKEVRMDVEQRLKDGELRAIVATSSLELGIDIGSVEKVILVQSPFSVASTLQRIGRANHRVGATSFAELIPLHGLDLVYCTVLAEQVRERRIETLHPVASPLDVLAQIILSLTAAEEWPVERLYQFIRTIHPYHELSRRFFDLTIEMLSGRYSDLPVRELRPRLEADVIAGTVKARQGTELVLYQSGGTIPDRGYFQLRVAGDQALLGELDEEFVWERRLGDQFTLGTAAWRITGINQNTVEVVPADPARLMIPFWKAEDLNRDFHTASAVGEFLEKINGRLADADFPAWLTGNYGLDAQSADNLIEFLGRQRAISSCDLPSRHHVLVEEIHGGTAGAMAGTSQLVLHTFWGGRVNKPLALAVAAVWEQTHGSALEFFAGNECIMFQLPEGPEGPDGQGTLADWPGRGAAGPLDLLAGLVTSRNVEELLRARLESSGLFGARFRENAARALLLPRGDSRRRVPLWMSRMRSRKLLDAVSASPEFPLTVETWRDCLQDEFDLESLKLILDELENGEIRLSWRRGKQPSPFAADLVWHQVNQDMYRDDTPPTGKGSSLSGDLFRELLGETRLRPAIPSELAGKFTAKMQGTWPEYRPDTPGQLLSVLNEQGFLPATLWDELCHFSSSGIAMDPAFQEDLTRLSRMFARFRPPGAAVDWIVAVPQLPLILPGLGLSLVDPPQELPREVIAWLREQSVPEPPVTPERLLLRWLGHQGPVALSRIHWMFGWTEECCLQVLQGLVREERVISGRLIEGSPNFRFCESRNYESLLRLHRSARRQGVATLPLDQLALFLGVWHGLVAPVAQPALQSLQDSVDRCIGFPLPAALWEQVVFPTRLRPYQPSWIDSLFANFGISWQGNGEGCVFLAFQDELALYRGEQSTDTDPEGQRVLAALGGPDGGATRGDVLEISRQTGFDSGKVTDLLWGLAWKGLVSADSFETLRRGIRSDFKADVLARGRSGFRRWENSRATVGNWYAVPPGREGLDSVDRLETSRELINQLLRRFGVVFKELLANELPRLQWAKVFRTLRLMELSGEVLAGRFFQGIPGIQFASPEAARRLQAWSFDEEGWESAVWWLNAMDPASLCGLGLDFSPSASDVAEGRAELRPPELELPRRVPGNWLVYAGTRLVMVVRRNGRDVDLCLVPGDSLIGRVLAFFPFLLSRTLDSGPSIMIETINGQAAASSPCLPDFRRAGFQADHHGLSLWKRY